MKIRNIITEQANMYSIGVDHPDFNDEDGHFEGDYGRFLQVLGNFTDDIGAREWDEKLHSEELRLFRKYSSQLYADNLLLYRGIVLKNWNELDDDFDFRTKPVLKYDYFLSTSLNRDVVEENYLDLFDEAFSVYLLFIIKPTFRTEGISIEYWADELDFLQNANPDLNFSWNPTDEEVILAPNSMRVVKKVQKPCPWKKDAEYWEVHLEAVV